MALSSPQGLWWGDGTHTLRETIVQWRKDVPHPQGALSPMREIQLYPGSIQYGEGYETLPVGVPQSWGDKVLAWRSPVCW